LIIAASSSSWIGAVIVSGVAAALLGHGAAAVAAIEAGATSVRDRDRHDPIRLVPSRTRWSWARHTMPGPGGARLHAGVSADGSPVSGVADRRVIIACSTRSRSSLSFVLDRDPAAVRARLLS